MPTLRLMISIFITSGIIYAMSGRYSQIKMALNDYHQFQTELAKNSTHQPNKRYIHALQQKLTTTPNDGDLWYELGQAYMLNNQFQSALQCYQYAQQLLGQKPAILGAIATAHYYENGQKLSPTTLTWINTALAKDDKESASLLLLASDAFLNHNYALALHYWRKVLDNDDDKINRRSIIQSYQLTQQLCLTEKPLEEENSCLYP